MYFRVRYAQFVTLFAMLSRRTLTFSVVWTVVAVSCFKARCDESARSDESGQNQPSRSWNFPSKTGGGAQFWTDERFFHGWRIQRNVVTGHFRLLDDRDVRQAWGSLAHCVDELDAKRQSEKLPPMSGRAVVLLHGLGRTRKSMLKMADYLKQGGYEVFSVSYASTRGSHDDHAAALAKIIAKLEGIEEINFVAHSMGNTVLRRYLAANAPAGQLPDRRIARIVMLAPPNQGATHVELLALDRAGNIAGKAAKELGPQWETFRHKMATPSCPFGILAGDGGDSDNPLIEGADDLVIPVETTKLSGARDFRVVPNVHTFLMNDAAVQRMTLNFLKHGFFETEAKRQPIR